MAGRHIIRQTDESLRALGINPSYRLDILACVRDYSVTGTGNADKNLSNNSGNFTPLFNEDNDSHSSSNQASGASVINSEQGSNNPSHSCSQASGAPFNRGQGSNNQTSSSNQASGLASNNEASGSSQMLLPSESDPDFVSALNAQSRVSRILEKAFNELYVKYNVQTIIEKGNGGPEIITALDLNGTVTGPQRLRLVNILMTHMLNNVANPALVSTNMREAMAICLVFRWRTLCSMMYKKEDRPWYDWYNPVHNMGALNHQLQTAHRAMKKKGKGIRKPEPRPKRPRVLKELPSNSDMSVDDPDPDQYAQDMNELKFIDASSPNKETVLSLMSQTFKRRRAYMQFKTCITTTEVIEKFPKFLSYHGDVLDQEFDLLFPGKGKNFIRNFTTDFVPRILKIAENEPNKFSNCISFCDDTLNATVVLGRILPTPKRTFTHEEKMPLHPGLPDFFRMIPLGSNPPEEAAKHRQEAGYPVQPHIMAIGHPKAMGTMYLVIGDSKIIELHRTATPTKAIDLLFKTYHALNIHYPLGWKNVLRFIALHTFHIPPEGKRESQFQAQLRQIKNISL